MVAGKRGQNSMPPPGWFDRSYRSAADPVIVGGCGRSGTTLLRVILDSHPDLACGPESWLFVRRRPPHGDPRFAADLSAKFDLPVAEIEAMVAASRCHGELIDRFFAAYNDRAGKQRWGEKTPRNVRVIGAILECFPRARFVHVIRDGRDTICSLRRHPRYRVEDGELVPTGAERPLGECIDRWLGDVAAGLEHRGDERCLEVRYEELVSAPWATLERLCSDLDLRFDPAMLRHHEIDGPSRRVERFPQNPEAVEPLYRSAVGRWQRELTAGELAEVEERAGALLDRLGYR